MCRTTMWYVQFGTAVLWLMLLVFVFWHIMIFLFVCKPQIAELFLCSVIYTCSWTILEVGGISGLFLSLSQSEHNCLWLKPMVLPKSGLLECSDSLLTGVNAFTRGLSSLRLWLICLLTCSLLHPWTFCLPDLCCFFRLMFIFSFSAKAHVMSNPCWSTRRTLGMRIVSRLLLKMG